MMNSSWIRRAAPVLSALFAVGLQTVFRACPQKEDGTWMNCHTVQTYLTAAAVVLAVLSALVLACRSAKAAAALCAAGIALTVWAMLLPGTIMHMCMMTDMRCYTMMRSFTWVMGILLIAVQGITIIQAFRTQKRT